MGLFNLERKKVWRKKRSMFYCVIFFCLHRRRDSFIKKICIKNSMFDKWKADENRIGTKYFVKFAFSE